MKNENSTKMKYVWNENIMKNDLLYIYIYIKKTPYNTSSEKKKKKLVIRVIICGENEINNNNNEDT